MKRSGIVLFFIASCSLLYSQKMSTRDYIARYKDEAIKNMQLKKIPASITLAQGILESGNGNSKLAKYGNNHFGIKCHKGWKGGTYYLDDDKPNECFRTYKTVLDSYKDHADFLTGRSRYAKLFELKITDYKGWARGLKAAGYATNPKYADLLINLIEKYELYKYDQEAINGNNTVVTSNQNNSNNNNNNSVTNSNNQVNHSEIININGLQAIHVAQGETKESLATYYDTKIKRIEKYNELGPGDELYEGQLIFLEPKRNSASYGNEYHTVKKGETFYTIAQQYGMKTDALMKKNKMWYASTIKPGDKLNLRKRKR